MKNKKILFVADSKSVHTAKWVDYFQQKYDVYLATFSDSNITKCKNILYLSEKKIITTGGNYHYLLSIPKLKKIIKTLKPDYINAHFSYSLGLVALLAKKISRHQCNFSVVCHGSDILKPPFKPIMNIINKYILKNSDKIFAVSNQIYDEMIQLKADKNKIFIGQYGINNITKKFEKNIDIISNRTYNDNSNIDFLLNCMDELKLSGLKIVFVLPTISDENYKKLVAKYPYIEFYKDIPYEDMISLVSSSKIYISATKSDGTSLSLLEAMNYKTLPIVSNIVSNRSWILNSINGFLFSNKYEFMEKLQYCLNITEEEQLEMININQKIIKKYCDYNSQMSKIEQFLIDENYKGNN